MTATLDGQTKLSIDCIENLMDTLLTDELDAAKRAQSAAALLELAARAVARVLALDSGDPEQATEQVRTRALELVARGPEESAFGAWIARGEWWRLAPELERRRRAESG
jgi:hypothetical protein